MADGRLPFRTLYWSTKLYRLPACLAGSNVIYAYRICLQKLKSLLLSLARQTRLLQFVPQIVYMRSTASSMLACTVALSELTGHFPTHFSI